MKQDYFLKTSLQTASLEVDFTTVENSEKRMCC